jgi:hypothetical protein
LFSCQQALIERCAMSITRPVFLFSNPRIVFSEITLGLLVNLWRRLHRRIFDSYRPELYYMRGPGPKWREKHARGWARVTDSWPYRCGQ